MLLGFGAKNFCCFKDWIDIDLRLNGYVPEEISLGKDYSLIMGFEGANASGKTNALKIMAFISDFAKNSFLYEPEQRIYFDTYFGDPKRSEFYVEFKASDGEEYRYELTANKEMILKESLVILKNNQEYVIFFRELNNITVNNLYNNDTNIIYRNNASFISTLHQYAIAEIQPMYSFFDEITVNVTYKGLRNEVNSDISIVSKNYQNNPEMLTFTKTLIHKFDTGINEIKILTK